MTMKPDTIFNTSQAFEEYIELLEKKLNEAKIQAAEAKQWSQEKEFNYWEGQIDALTFSLINLF